jgi:hypothetical protein
MAMKVRRTFPDWAPIMDLQVASSAGQTGDRGSKRPSIFATSGRQPYGAISELRKGLEARVLIEADLGQSDGLSGSYGLWSLIDPFGRGHHFFLTYPDATSAWLLNTEDEMEPSELNLDSECGTLLATITSNNLIIQATERALSVSLITEKSPPRPLVVPEIPQGSRIIAASFDEDKSVLLLAVRSGEQTYLDLFTIPTTVGSLTVTRVGTPLALDVDLTCLSLFQDRGVLFAVTGLRNGMLHLFSLDFTSGISSQSKTLIESNGSTQMSPVAQSVLVMSRNNSHMLSCGLRNGEIFTVGINFGSQGVHRIPCKCSSNWSGALDSQRTAWANPRTIEMGTGPVNLFRNTASSVFAICGYDTCRLEYSSTTSGLVISTIFLTDPTNPDLFQPRLSALQMLAQSDPTTSQIACIDGTTLRIALLDDRVRVIPRRIPLSKNILSPDSLGAFVEPSGTPQRLLYSPRLDALVIGSVKFEHKALSTKYPGPMAPYLGMRTNRGVLQFMPLDNEDIPPGIGEVQPLDKSTLVELLPGEKLMTMVEYRYRRELGKPGYYFFLLAGTKQTKEDGTQNGRLLFLSSDRQDNGTISVTMPIARTYEYPIRALAICDTKIVISGNTNITVYELANIPHK